jgi:hypothetical protein
LYRSARTSLIGTANGIPATSEQQEQFFAPRAEACAQFIIRELAAIDG